MEQLEDRRLLAVLTVDTRLDILDPNDQFVSLREAINAANDEVANPGRDTINFDADLTYSTILLGVEGFDENGAIPSTTGFGELVITSDMTIRAGDATLVRIGREIGNEGLLESARLDHRVLRIEAGSVELENLIIQRGQTTEGDYGAGIWNAGTLTLTNSIVGDNVQRADTSGELPILGGGGGIFNAPAGTMSLVNTTVGSIELDVEALESLGIDPSQFPTGSNGQPLLIPGNVAEGLGGGVFNEGILSLSAESSISFNDVAYTGDNINHGGGIFNAGTLEIVDSIVANNTAPLFSGIAGGGIHSSTMIPRGDVDMDFEYDFDVAPGPVSVSIDNSTLAGNRAGNGGGIYVGADTSLLVTDSTLSKNTAQYFHFTGQMGDGGAIDNDGIAVIEGSTFMSNAAEQNGGAIHSTLQLTLRSSTVSANGNFGGILTNSGGGVYVADGIASVLHSTIAYNEATGTSGGVRNIGSTHFDNSIIANNSAGANGPDGNSTGTVTAVNSLISNNSSSNGPFLLEADGNLLDVDPLLGPLGEHGGPTLTHGLLVGSPAIDSSYTEITGGIETDQRGQPRLVGPAMDMGAFESQPPATMRVDSLGDVVNGYYGPGDFTLREAVLWAGHIPGPDSIGFSRDLVRLLENQPEQDPLVLDLTEGQIVIDSDIIIRGPGADILPVSGNLNGRIFAISPGVKSEISGLTLTEGDIGGGSGGAIYNQGDLTLRDAVITNSFAGSGGGILNHELGTLTLDGTHVKANFAQFNAGGIVSRGNLTLLDSTISENVSDNSTGGISVGSDSQFTATNTTISSNRSDTSGGGIRFNSGIGVLRNVTITNNFAAESENANSDDAGGGIWSSSNADVTLHNTIVWGNFSNRRDHDLFGNYNQSSAFNLIGVGGNLIDGVNDNQVGVTSALLGPLRNASGKTPVHALRPGSPAIDAADPVVTLRTDQRGQARAVDDPNTEVFSRPPIVRLTDVFTVTTNVSSSYEDFGPGRALDGDLETSWFTDVGDAANLGTTPFYEVIFQENVTVTQINMRGNREFPNNYEIFQGRYDLFDVGDNLLYSNEVNLPTPFRDLDLEIPTQSSVRRVRFTIILDESVDPGFSELEILGPASFPFLLGPSDIGAYEYVPPELSNPIVVDTLSGVSDGIYGPGQVSLGDAIAFANASPTHNEIVFDPSLFVEDADVPLDADTIVNLVQALPVTAAASSFFSGNPPEDAIDGDLDSSWFTASGDAANLGRSPWFEVEFGEDVTVTHITMRSTRSNPTGLDFIEGRFDVFDEAGVVLHSTVVTLPELLLPPAERDLQLDIPDQIGARRVRFTSLKDEGQTPGFADLEVYGTSGLIGLNGEQLVVSDDLVITGPGSGLLSISGNRQNRILRILDTGGGVPNVTLSGVTLTNGRIQFGFGDQASGGAIWNSGDLTLEDVYVANNSIEEYRYESADGGGIYNDGTLTLENTTVAMNSTVSEGGGIYNAGILAATNSTITTNLAAPAPAGNVDIEGGGLYNAAGATATLNYTTVMLNQANRIDALGSGIYNAGELMIGNSIVAENGVAPFFGDDGWTRPGGVSTSVGYNFIGSNDDFNLNEAEGDQFGSASNRLDPFLTDLIAIGGSVPMHGALPSSPVVDAANPAEFPDFDQRGMARPENGLPDIGAFELEDYSWGSALVVTSFSDELDADYSVGSLTLREAILWANAQDGSAVTNGIDVITFCQCVIGALVNGDFGTNTLVLNGKQLIISDDLVIVDPGSVLDEPVSGAEIFRISADERSRVLMVESGATVQISGLTFADGEPQSSDPSDDGGAILNRGNLALIGVIVEDSFTDDKGGGIYNDSGVLTIEYSTIRGNITNTGGGGGGGGIHNEAGELHIQASTISDNLAGSASTNAAIGGGIYHVGTVATISASTISHNRSQRNGGGIYVDFPSTISIFNSTISNNDALAGFGGGIYSSGTVELLNVTVAENIAGGSSGGGGFYVSGGTVRIGNTIVATNGQIGGDPNRDEGVISGGVTFESLGHNLFGLPIFGGPTIHPSDMISSTPELGPLAHNGGPTKTHLLKATSPAIDAADAMLGLAAFSMRIMDQRGRPLVDIADDELTTDGDFDIPDIGAYEVQGVGVSRWDYDALDLSQFGPGPALVYGFGFDEGVPNSSINPDPYFLGFQFDTGPQKAGKIVEGLFGTKFGGELAWDFSGKLGFDLGFYINSGSVDVSYDGNVNYVIDNYPSGDRARVSTFVDIDDGSLFTVSPKIGAYADLVIELNADVSATGCLFGCIGVDLLNIHFDHSEELFSINRQIMDDSGRPMFFDQQGNAFARDSSTGNFHYPDYSDPSDPTGGNPVSPVLQQQLVAEGVLPIFDGEIRTFSLDLIEIANGIVEGAQDSLELADTIETLKSGRDLHKANGDVTKANNRLRQREDELADLKERRDNASTAAEVVNANREIERLEGRDGNGGQLKESREALAGAQEKQKKAQDDYEGKARDTLKSIKSGVGVSFSEAEGSLLGAQLDLEVGLGVNGADIARKLGSIQVTLPDVNLVDPTADDMGVLHATTDAFPKQSDLDFKRQLASVAVDLATFLPFPAGKYEINLGPLSLGVTTVSYNIGPQLNVTQDVSAMPVAKELTYDFFEHNSSTAAEVFVMVNGVMQRDVLPGPDENIDTLSSVKFAPGSSVEVVTANTLLAGQPIDVTPTLAMDARFSNDIGLDIDLEGVFEAFALSLSAFGLNIIDLGPLIRHQHTISTFDLGSVFTRTFDLDQQSTTLETFTLFNQMMDGRTAATALMTEPATSNVSSVNVAASSIEPGRPLFVRSDLIHPDVSDELYTVLDVVITGADVDNLYVLDESLTVSPGTTAGTFQISGFREQMLSQQSSALFAIAFAESASATVTATRSTPVSLTMPPDITDNTGGVTGDGFEEVGAAAVFNNDIDGDGIASPLSDGVLMIRYLDGLRGEELVAGAVSPGATRTDPVEIAEYIDDVLERTIRYTDPDTGETSLRNTLDFDASGIVPTADGDGVLLARYLADFRDEALTSGASSAAGADVAQFIETGRTSASEINLDEFAKIIDRGGHDLLGLDDTLNADRNDGSSASAATNPMGAGSGASPEFAITATSSSGTGSGVEIFDFALTQFGNSVMFREIYLDGELISRVADGSPIDFGAEAYADLIDGGADPEMFTSQTGTAILGIEEPIFVRAPDAVGYQYEALDGYGFESFVIDPQVGGNLLLPSEFDLYLFNDSSGEWEFATQITGEKPNQVGTNGFLFHEFTEGAVTQFRLYSSALPNEELHDADNTAAPELFTTTGFLLAEPGGGTAMPPTVRMIPLAERQLFFIPDAVTIEMPVFSSDTSEVITNFTLVRASADVVPSINGEPGTPIPMATVSELRVTGHDNVEDTLTLDSSGGPLRMPLVFSGGFRYDALVIDSTNGSGLAIDLVDRDSLLEIEVVDIRGSGDNFLILDHAAVVANDPFTHTLQVRGDEGDQVSLDDGWIIDGTVVIDDVQYDRYFQGDATLLVESAAEISIRQVANATGHAAHAGQAENSQPERTGSGVTFSSGFGPILLTGSVSNSHLSGTTDSAFGSGQGMGDRPVQMITGRSSLPAIIPGVPVSVSVDYRAISSTTTNTPGLHLRMHYDSSKLTLTSLSDLLPMSFSVGDGQSEPSVGDLDRDPSTDSYVNLLWIDAAGNWPGNSSVELFTANFAVVEPFSGSTHINFTGSPAAGFTLVAPSIVIGELPGDYNRDMVVDDTDYDHWRSTFGNSVTAGTAADGNADGLINAADYVVWRDNLGRSLSAEIGDYDRSGTVNQSDYDLWRQSFGSTTDLAADGNADGVVNAADYVVWRNNLGQITAAALAQVDGDRRSLFDGVDTKSRPIRAEARLNQLAVLHALGGSNDSSRWQSDEEIEVGTRRDAHERARQWPASVDEALTDEFLSELTFRRRA